jgi:hypothetical protein
VEKSASNLPGSTKSQIVLDSIIAGTNILSGASTNERVQQISGLINLFVSILNTSGIFKKAPVQTQTSLKG